MVSNMLLENNAFFPIREVLNENLLGLEPNCIELNLHIYQEIVYHRHLSFKTDIKL